MNSRLLVLVPLAAFLLSVPSSLLATTWNVPGDMSNTCTVGVPSCDTITAAVAAASPGDDIQVAAGTYNENSIVVDDQLTINGADAMTTVVDAAGAIGFFIRADGVVISNLTIQNGLDGVRLDAPSVDDLELNTVRILANSSDGVQIGDNPGTYTNIAVIDSTFSGNGFGIRMNSTSVVDGLSVSGSTFSNTGIGIYQANEGVGPPSSQLANLQVSDSRFENNASTAAIFAEELRDSVIETSIFEDNQRDVLLFKAYTTSGVDAGNITIRNNEFIDSRFYSVGIVVQAQGLGNPVNIEGNDFNQDVGVLTGADARIEIRLGSGFTHAAVNVTDNRIALSGTLVVAAAHGVAVRGNGPVTITGNAIDGGGVGGAGGGAVPPSSGVFIRSINSLANFAAIPSGASITGSCNRITEFQNGVSIFDSVGMVLGGLNPGATVAINDSVIAGNALSGVANGGTPSIDAENNFWGCAAGPGNPGCDSVIGAVDFMPFAASAPDCVPSALGEECLAPTDCVSGFCADGVCCDDACTAPGARCDTPAAPGMCIEDLGEPCIDGSTCELGFCVDGVCCVSDMCPNGCMTNGLCGVAAPVPLLSTWSLVASIGLLLAVAGFAVRRREA